MDSINSLNSDLRVESLKILSELSVMFLSKQQQPANNAGGLVSQDVREDLKFAIETDLIDM
jgi:hypothetical protein